MSDEVGAIRTYLQDAGCWNDAYEPLAVELVELRRAHAEAFARAQADPVARGSKQQERENPAWSTALKLGERCLRLSEDLLLTPKARSRARIPFDAGTIPDLFADLYDDAPVGRSSR
jgi:hypothetical protein